MIELLKDRSEIKDGVGIIVGERDADARQGLPERARVELESMARRPAVDAARSVERLQRLHPPHEDGNRMPALWPTRS